MVSDLFFLVFAVIVAAIGLMEVATTGTAWAWLILTIAVAARHITDEVRKQGNRIVAILSPPPPPLRPPTAPKKHPAFIVTGRTEAGETKRLRVEAPNEESAYKAARRQLAEVTRVEPEA